VKFLVVFLLLASTCAAQSTVRVKLTDGTRKWYEPLPVPHHTADSAFWESTVASFGANVVDVENTVYALRRPGAIEANLIFGKHPSRARLYATTTPMSALCGYLSWRYKREDDALKAAGIQGHKYSKWWVPSLLNTSFHVVGIVGTMVSTGR
jgi:hypothetical protein